MKTVIVKAPGLVSGGSANSALYIAADNFYLVAESAEGFFINDSLIGPAINFEHSFRIEGSSYIVPSWDNINIFLLWTNRSELTGDVAWQCLVNNNMEGGSISTFTPAVVTVAAPALNVIKRTQLAAHVPVVKEQLTGLNLQRAVEQVSDTLDATVSALALIVTRSDTPSV